MSTSEQPSTVCIFTTNQKSFGGLGPFSSSWITVFFQCIFSVWENTSIQNWWTNLIWTFLGWFKLISICWITVFVSVCSTTFPYFTLLIGYPFIFQCYIKNWLTHTDTQTTFNRHDQTQQGIAICWDYFPDPYVQKMMQWIIYMQ